LEEIVWEKLHGFRKRCGDFEGSGLVFLKKGGIVGVLKRGTMS